MDGAGATLGSVRAVTASLSWLTLAALAVALGVATVFVPIPAAAALGVLGVVALAGVARHGFAVLALAALAVAPVLGSFADVEGASAAMRWVDDGILAAGVALLAGHNTLLAVEHRRLGTAAVVLLALSAIVGLFASEAGWAIGVTSAWQSLRWVGLLGWGLLFAKRLSLPSRMRWAFYLLVAWNAANLVVAGWQFLSGAIDDVRFSVVPVAEGVFSHAVPGSLAAATLVVLALADRLSPAGNLTRRQRAVAVALGVAGLVATMSIQPLVILGTFALLFLMFRHGARGGLAPRVAALAAVPLVLAGAVLLLAEIDPDRAPVRPVAADVQNHAMTRAELMAGAHELASLSFPVGHGLGTYGSALDERLEDRTFSLLGLSSRYGFSHDDPQFRSDCGIAHILGERGYLGLGLWLLGMALVLTVALRLSLSTRHLFVAAGPMAALSILAVGPSFHSAAYTFILLLPAVLCLPVVRAHDRLPELPEASPGLRQRVRSPA